MARFAEIKGINTSKLDKFACVYVAIVAIVVIGPPIEDIGSWKVKSKNKLLSTTQARPNAKELPALKLH